MEQVSPCLFRQGSRREGDRTEQTQQEARREKKVEEGLAECLLHSLLLPSFFPPSPEAKKNLGREVPRCVCPLVGLSSLPFRRGGAIFVVFWPTFSHLLHDIVHRAFA